MHVALALGQTVNSKEKVRKVVTHVMEKHSIKLLSMMTWKENVPNELLVLDKVSRWNVEAKNLS